MRQQRRDAQAGLDGVALVHEGHQPRPLQQKATSRVASQSSHVTSEKPYRTSPQRWYALASRFTCCGTELFVASIFWLRFTSSLWIFFSTSS